MYHPSCRWFVDPPIHPVGWALLPHPPHQSAQEAQLLPILEVSLWDLLSATSGGDFQASEQRVAGQLWSVVVLVERQRPGPQRTWTLSSRFCPTPLGSDFCPQDQVLAKGL